MAAYAIPSSYNVEDLDWLDEFRMVEKAMNSNWYKTETPMEIVNGEIYDLPRFKNSSSIGTLQRENNDWVIVFSNKPMTIRFKL